MTFDDWWGAYPTQEDYEANCRDAWEAGAASRDAEITELRQQVTLLRGSLLASANYIDALGGNSFDPRRILAATKEK